MRSGPLALAGLCAVGAFAAGFAAAGRLSQTPAFHAARALQALRDGNAEEALRWVDVPALAASVVDAVEDAWVDVRAGDPARYVASPVARPVLRGVFGLARGSMQRRVEAQLRDTVRRIAAGGPDAPVQLPRWGGLPVALAAVWWLADVQWLSPDRVKLSAGPADRPWLRVHLAWRNGRWVVVAADREWVASLVRPHLVRPPGPEPTPSVERP